MIIAQGDRNRFANGLQAGKVDHRVDPVFRKDAVQCAGVEDIILIERDGFPRDFLNAPHSFLFGVAKVVHNHNLVARGKQFNTCVGADKTRSAGNQYFHSGNTPLSNTAFCRNFRPAAGPHRVQKTAAGAGLRFLL